nr:MAG TPA: hypothetical protein [Caudoviricetes sp.]
MSKSATDWKDSPATAKRYGRFYPTQERALSGPGGLRKFRRNTKQDGSGEWVEDDFTLYY